MSYRAWPAALLTGAALSAACVVVGEHVVQTRDGCLDSTSWFTATPAAWPDTASTVAGKGTAEPDRSAERDKAQIDVPATVHGVGQPGDQQDPGNDQISGCLDLDRIEIPAPGPSPDGRA